MSVDQCTYPKCQATSGCVGACSKTAPVAWAEITKEYVAVSDEQFENAIPLYAAPVHVSDISKKRVDETAKDRHEPTPWEGIRETVELRGSHSEEYEEGFWAGLRAYEDKLREQDWYGQHQWQCGYERGWDAAMEQKHKYVDRLCRIMGTFDLATGHADTIDEALDALESELRDVLGHLRARREWVGLEEEEILKCFDSVSLGQVEGDCVIDKHVNIFNAIRAIEAKLKEKNI